MKNDGFFRIMILICGAYWFLYVRTKKNSNNS